MCRRITRRLLPRARTCEDDGLHFLQEKNTFWLEPVHAIIQTPASVCLHWVSNSSGVKRDSPGPAKTEIQ